MVSPDGVGRYARFYPAVIKALEVSPRKLSKIYPLCIEERGYAGLDHAFIILVGAFFQFIPTRVE